MDEIGTLFVTLIVSIVVGCVFGGITHAIQDSKGYSETGFWWGFWLGWIGIIVVACKPNLNEYYYSHRSGNGPSPVVSNQSVPPGGWRCSCGRSHSSYVSSCVCGKNKSDIRKPAPTSTPKISAPTQSGLASKQSSYETENDKIAALREYKLLLDSGVITEEEFERKKQQLLK